MSMGEKGCLSFNTMIDMMVREENQKTIYTAFDDSRRIIIIPDSEFKKDCNESSPMFTGNHFLQFDYSFYFIEVMDDSKILLIDFALYLEIYNIEEDPLHPKFVKRLDFGWGKSHFYLKLDENLLLI